MRIVLDMQGAQTESRFRGIGRYTLSFALGLVRNRGEHEVYLVLNGMLMESINGIRAAFEGLLPRSHIRVWYAEGPVNDAEAGNQSRRDVAQLIRQACIDELRPDVVHVTSSVEGYIDDAVIGSPSLNSAALLCATLYDLIPLQRPQQYLDGNPVYKAHYLEKVSALKDYDLLLSISDFARGEALSLLPVQEGSIVNVSTAADDIFHVMEVGELEKAALGSKFNLAGPFVLYSGGADDRKNLPLLIQAFAKIYAGFPGLQLVFAGRMPDFHVNKYRGAAADAGLPPTAMVFTGYITDRELVALYSLCRVYAFPSWHEGFGLPPLEAMKCGAPVIGANASSIPEVIGREDALFDPYDVESLADKLNEVLTDDAFRGALSAYGIERAKEFSWDRTAVAAINAYESKLAERDATAPVHTSRPPNAVPSALIESLVKLEGVRQGAVDLAVLAKCVDYSLQGAGHTRTIFLDISELCKHDGKSGIQRVVRSILLEWLRHPPAAINVRPVYTKSGESFYRHATSFCSRFIGEEVVEGHEDEVISYRAGDIYLCIDLLMDVLPHKKVFLNAMRAHGVAVYFVIYDLLILQMPHCFVESLQQHYITWLNAVVEFDGAMCISQAVADDLKAWMAARSPAASHEFKIGAFHLGADIEQSAPSKGLPENPSLRIESLDGAPSFLMVGTLEPRKGHAQVIDAFDLLWAEGVHANLIIVGKHGWLVDKLAERILTHPQLGKRLLWLDGISDEYLEFVLKHSSCLIAASEGEGFGLPLIEAAQHGLPIIARDIPVFREVAGSHAHYFCGLTGADLAQELRRWMDLHERGEHAGSKLMPWLTWKESAQQLLQLVQEFDASPNPVQLTPVHGESLQVREAAR